MCSPELQMLTSNLIGKWGEKVRIEVQSSSHSWRKGKPVPLAIQTPPFPSKMKCNISGVLMFNRQECRHS